MFSFNYTISVKIWYFIFSANTCIKGLEMHIEMYFSHFDANDRLFCWTFFNDF